MKRLLQIIMFFMIVLVQPYKSFAQLEKKIIYIYKQGDKLHYEFYCTDEKPHASDVTASLNDLTSHNWKYVTVTPYPKRSTTYWSTTDWDGVYLFKLVTHAIKEENEFWNKASVDYFYFYESLNIITPVIDPSKMTSDKEKEIMNNPWKYGEKAVYNRIITEEDINKQKEQERKRKEKEEQEDAYKKFEEYITQYKHLFTQDELNKFKTKHIAPTDYENTVVKRQKIYDLIAKHPEVFSKDYYYEVIPQYKILERLEKKLYERININFLVGNWKQEKGKGTECIITNQNDQLYITLKYKKNIIFEGYVTGGQAVSKENDQGLFEHYGIRVNRMLCSVSSKKPLVDIMLQKNNTEYKLCIQKEHLILIIQDKDNPDSITFNKQ